MGEIAVDFELENSVDVEVFERGLGEESGVRRARAHGVVDTGATMLVLPQNLVERLGLIGQIVLEALDLIADCKNRTLTPRVPDHPVLRA